MKRLTKKVLLAFGSMFFIFSLHTSIALAKTSDNNEIIIEQGRYKSTSSDYTSYNVGNYEELLNALTESIDKIEGSAKIICKDNYLSDFEVFKTEFRKATAIASIGSYLESYKIYSYTEGNNKIYDVKYNYPNGIEEARKKKAAVEKSVNKIISEIITENMSDYEKERAIHDYIVLNTSYDIENADNDTIPLEAHTPYGVFINKVAVCDGYASATKKLLDKVNIKNLLVVGEAGGEPHSWNLINTENKWRHLDVTWDDAILVTEEGYEEIITYDYFNKTDDFMEKNHIWEKSDYPKVISPVNKNKKGTRYIKIAS